VVNFFQGRGGRGGQIDGPWNGKLSESRGGFFVGGEGLIDAMWNSKLRE